MDTKEPTKIRVFNKATEAYDQEMYELACPYCGKKLLSFGKKQIVRNMDLHKASCSERKNKHENKE